MKQVGVDPEGNLLFVKTSPKEEESWFEKFFVIDKGVISFSLRDLTLIGCTLLSVSISYMLYEGCSKQMVKCTEDDLPVISRVLALPFFDRIFCLLSAGYAFAIH